MGNSTVIKLIYGVHMSSSIELKIVCSMPTLMWTKAERLHNYERVGLICNIVCYMFVTWQESLKG